VKGGGEVGFVLLTAVEGGGVRESLCRPRASESILAALYDVHDEGHLRPCSPWRAWV
jgi:hypothetical protein